MLDHDYRLTRQQTLPVQSLDFSYDLAGNILGITDGIQGVRSLEFFRPLFFSIPMMTFMLAAMMTAMVTAIGSPAAMNNMMLSTMPWLPAHRAQVPEILPSHPWSLGTEVNALIQDERRPRPSSHRGAAYLLGQSSC